MQSRVSSEREMRSRVSSTENVHPVSSRKHELPEQSTFMPHSLCSGGSKLSTHERPPFSRFGQASRSLTEDGHWQAKGRKHRSSSKQEAINVEGQRSQQERGLQPQLGVAGAGSHSVAAWESESSCRHSPLT